MDGTEAGDRLMVMLDDTCAKSNERHFTRKPSKAQTGRIHPAVGETLAATGHRKSSLIVDKPRPLSILYRGQALAEALAAGLSARGWLPEIAGELPAGENGGAPVLLVENDFGDLPDTALAMATRIASRQPVVAVAGPAALAALVRAVTAGATAINADQPYRRLLTFVDAALASAPPAAPTIAMAQRERMLTDLRQRAEEARRFRELTEGECAVLASMAAGLSAESIASARSVGLSTVRSQIAAILRKLGVQSQTAAVSLTYKSCADNRIIDPLTSFNRNYLR